MEKQGAVAEDAAAALVSCFGQIVRPAGSAGFSIALLTYSASVSAAPPMKVPSTICWM